MRVGKSIAQKLLVVLYQCPDPGVRQLPGSEGAEGDSMGVRDRVHTELMSSDRFITSGLVPALLQLGELTLEQGWSREG